MLLYHPIIIIIISSQLKKQVNTDDAKPKNDARPTYNYYDWGDYSAYQGSFGESWGGKNAAWCAGKSFTTTAMNER